MRFLFALEYAIVLLVLWVILTQMIIPKLFGEPMFPYFRWKRIKRTQAEIREAIAQEEAEQQIRAALAEYERLKKADNPPQGEKNDTENNP